MAKPPPTCDYCNRPTAFLPSSEAVYGGLNYGPLYVCWPCEAWVGCHRMTLEPLGRLANKELRAAKMRAHAAFDPIWRARYERRKKESHEYTRRMARGGRYKALAVLLGIERHQCHIGMFDVELCARVVEICQSGRLEA